MAMSSSGSGSLIRRQHVLGRLLDDRRARVVVLVDPVAEAHQLDAALLVLHPPDERVDVAAVGLDAAPASPARPGWRRRAAARTARSPRPRPRRTGWPGRAHQPHRRRRAVLLVVGVQHEQHVQHLGHDRVDLVLRWPARRRSSAGSCHVVQRVVRVEHRLPDRLLVRVRGDRRHLRHQPDRGDLAPGRGRTGRGCPGRTSTARSPRRNSTAIGCASRGKPSKNRRISSCSSVCRLICSEKSASSAAVGSSP